MQETFQSPARHRQRGFTLLEVTLSLIIFTMMTLMFGAVLPIAVRGANHGNNYSQAAALAQRKIDQLRAAGYSRLFDDGGRNGNSAFTKLFAQKVVDGQNGASGAGGGSYDFTTQDNLTGAGGFFPAGSTGTITVVPDAQAAGVAQVTVTITWTGTVPGSYTVSALIISMFHK